MLIASRKSAPQVGAPHRKRSGARFDTKAISEDGEFEGYASIFGVVDSVGDVVMPGAYAATIAAHAEAGTMPKLLWQHDAAEPVGVWLEMREDNRGLWMRGRLILDVARAREARALMLAGAIDGLSIGFDQPDCAFVRSDDPDVVDMPGAAGFTQIRRIMSLDLWETSIVTFPACEPARVQAVKAAPDFAPLAAALARRQRAIAEIVNRVA